MRKRKVWFNPMVLVLAPAEDTETTRIPAQLMRSRNWSKIKTKTKMEKRRKLNSRRRENCSWRSLWWFQHSSPAFSCRWRWDFIAFPEAIVMWCACWRGRRKLWRFENRKFYEILWCKWNLINSTRQASALASEVEPTWFGRQFKMPKLQGKSRTQTPLVSCK